MQVSKKDLSKAEQELIIEVNSDELKPFLLKAARRLSQNMKIEGFRPGMAPYEIVKQRAGEMAIYSEAVEDVVSHFYFLAVTKENLNTVGQPKIEIEKMAPGNPVSFKAVVSIMPEDKLGDYKKTEVKKTEVKVEDKDVDKTLDDLRRMQVKEVLVDRPAKMGDRVEVDFEVSLDKVVIEGGRGQKYPMVLGQGQMIPGFEEQIVEMKNNEEKTFQLKFPEKYQNKMVAGKQCDFKIKLLAVYQQDLPQLTDDWAKGLGAESVTDLKSKIRKNLTDEKQSYEDQRTETELLKKIVANCEFSEIPQNLTESETHRMFHEFADSITAQGIVMADYLKSLNKTAEEIQTSFRPKAEERVKTSIVIKEIGDIEKIEVTDEELNKETESILLQVKGNPEAEANIKTAGYRQYLKTIVRNKKVLDLLKQECIK